MIRLGLSVAVGLACGLAFLLLTRPSVPYIVAAALIASVLAAIFTDVFRPSTATSRSREAARAQDPYEEQARGVDG